MIESAVTGTVSYRPTAKHWGEGRPSSELQPSELAVGFFICEVMRLMPALLAIVVLYEKSGKPREEKQPRRSTRLPSHRTARRQSWCRKGLLG